MPEESSFSRYFESLYGPRWERLLAALQEPTHKVSRRCFDGFADYVMDPASIRAALALQVQPGDRVLDLCAAPGGKTLILAEALGKKGHLIANEWSADRRRRLKDVIESHVPPQMRDRVTIGAWDGNRFGLERPGEFDRILVDAPCSSERHLIEKDQGVSDWKESRTKSLAMRQYSLLCSAILALKPGGSLVYSTCSISMLENDGVIERVIKKKNHQVKWVRDLRGVGELPKGTEETRFGVQWFPDLCPGEGPIYLAQLVRISEGD